jgi:hypothetical protein
MAALGVEDPSRWSRFVARWQLGDPTSPRDSWRPWRREALSQRLAEQVAAVDAGVV